MPTVHLGLGSNLGDRLAALRHAVALLAAVGRVERVSSVYETAPFGVTDQPPFLNACLALATALPPPGLLARTRDIERALGRVERTRWGPREIDVDILLVGDLELDTPALVLPHPRMRERSFVLVPLAEIAPAAIIPGVGGTVEGLLGKLMRTPGDVVVVGPPSLLTE